MSRNITSQEVQSARTAVDREIAALRNKQITLRLLQQMQRQGVTHARSNGFVTGSARPNGYKK